MVYTGKEILSDNEVLHDLIKSSNEIQFRDQWVPVTTAWSVLRLRKEERTQIWRVAANILNKQSRIADKEWSSSLEDGRGANNSSP